MKYMGSKNRIAKHILPIILKDRKENQYYVEPFCGGLGTFDKVTGNRIGADKNKYLIAMWKGLQENRDKPMEIPKELYSKARTEYNNGTNIEFDDFICVWSKEVTNSMNTTLTYKPVERLFVYGG